MSGYKLEKLKVLVVDDNAHMRRLVVTILQAFGAGHIYEEPDGLSAWEGLRELNPDVVILDMMMPGMTGTQFVKQVRTHPQSPNPFLPVIMVTCSTNLENVHRARDAGVNEFLAKPVSIHALISRLVSVIEHPRPYVRTKAYFGPCRRRRGAEEYRGPERRTATPAASAAA